MRTLILAAAAPAALLALAAAAPASAEPLRLDEGRLAGVAAGQDIVVTPVAPVTPDFNISSLSSSSTTTSTSNAVDTSVGQMLSGVTDNSNTALGMNSTGVAADGTAATTVTGMITGFGAP